MQSIDLKCGSAGKYIIFYILLADTFCVLTSISSTCDADAGPVLLAGALAGIAAWVPTVKLLKSTQRYEYAGLSVDADYYQQPVSAPPAVEDQ